ncbi:hypothetical protein C4N18_07815 [Fusobacterium varium ATCC 27725]|uniref:Uncharacterized protein n=1 Tax=Fusobacterium varium ATCC 27725 TaxID=469618 RepID=A0ABM6U469_FUSVA|nr:hypothetical protein C4N18_07815 [Fusobacterium varium ATCC 27725]
MKEVTHFFRKRDKNKEFFFYKRWKNIKKNPLKNIDEIRLFSINIINDSNMFYSILYFKILNLIYTKIECCANI